MPFSDWRSRIEDILDSIGAIRRYTEGMTVDAFVADPKTVDAVLRHFIVIGEAARHVPPDLAARHPAVPWRQIRGLRNIAVHEYGRVNNQVIWQTISQDLTPLERSLRFSRTPAW